jgi:hypothetical protein
MTLLEFKKKYLSLIEELNPLSDQLTDDPDIAAKQNEVINQRMFELARFKKIPRYVPMEVKEGQTIEFADIEKVVGNEVYQIDVVYGVRYVPRADGTVLKFLGSGTAEINCFVYPERITEKTKDKSYEFELSPDALEILPYGVAADLLKADVSAEYGAVYERAYQDMIQRLDSRYHMAGIFVEGGYDL